MKKDDVGYYVAEPIVDTLLGEYDDWELTDALRKDWLKRVNKRIEELAKEIKLYVHLSDEAALVFTLCDSGTSDIIRVIELRPLLDEYLKNVKTFRDDDEGARLTGEYFVEMGNKILKACKPK